MKQNIIYREILTQLIENRKTKFTQKELSFKLNLSIGLINYVIQKLEEIGCIIKKQRGFEVIDPKKMLVYWASIYKLPLIKKFCVNMHIDKIETNLPKNSRLTCYSGARRYYNIYPSDYSEVFVYCELTEIKDRFTFKKGKENLFILRGDAHLFSLNRTPLPQIFVDLWNVNTWYAKDFLKEVEVRIDGVLARLGY